MTFSPDQGPGSTTSASQARVPGPSNGGAPSVQAAAVDDRVGVKVAPAQARTPAHILGEVVALMGQSPAHKHLFLSDLEWLISPPMMLGQLRIVYESGRPVAVAIWAQVSEEVEQELQQGRARLKPDEWKSGDRLWLIELIAPSFTTERERAASILATVARDVFKGEQFKLRGLNPKTGTPGTFELSSKPVDSAEADVKAGP